MDKNQLYKNSLLYSKELVDFLNASHSVYHVSAFAQQMLERCGYKRILENESWDLKKGGKYFFQRNQTAVIAFAVGNNFDENNTGFKIIGAHIDSPCLQLAPVSKLKQVGYNQSCIQTYGGGLWPTWFDRDLNLAGKIIVQDPATKKFTSKLWNSKKPIMKIPNLAIHLETSAERAGFSVNTETQLRPIISTEILDSIFNVNSQAEQTSNAVPCFQKHYSRLMDIISADLNIDKSTIYDMALQLSDSTKANTIGVYDEFITGERIDDLICTFAALKAFEQNSTYNKKYIDIITLFDHEEIGSQSAYGAKSTLLYELLERIMSNLCQDPTIQQVEQAKANSLIISADVAHAINPNYQDRQTINSQNKLNEGIQVGFDPNQSVASSIATRSLIYELGNRANIPILDGFERNGPSGGSTIGPMISANTSIKTADVGPGVIGMHSIRETAGIFDAYYYFILSKTFFDQFEDIQSNKAKQQKQYTNNEVIEDGWELIEQI